MKVYGVQLDIQWENTTANYERVRNLLREAAPEPKSLIILPEMFATGFSMNVSHIVKSSSETELFLSELASEFSAFVLGGLAVANGDGWGRNEAIFVTPNGEEQSAKRYRKMHVFSISGESAHFVSGEQIVTIYCKDFIISPFICYDLRFPEIFRMATKRGANLFCVIANWPTPRDAHWHVLLMARAIENQAYVIGVNRCGDDPKSHYVGRSQIIDPRGEILADGGSAEGIISATLNLEDLKDYQRQFPTLQDIKLV